MVVAAAEGPLSVADTVALPPFSEIESEDADRVTVGVDSSSVVLTDTCRTPSRA